VSANFLDENRGYIVSMGRGDLKEREWEKIEPLLPPQKPPVGRPAKDHRQILNGILFILRTGVPWRDLPERYGSWHTVSSRFYRWTKQGVWQQILEALLQLADENDELNWTQHFIDTTVVRAHQHAAGAKKGMRKPKRLGAAKAVSPPKSTFEPMGMANPLPSS
jgi:transposase